VVIERRYAAMSDHSTEQLGEGWYLMSTGELERELRRRRAPESSMPPSGARRLSIADALAYRNAGNLPDANGRTLRLVLWANRSPGAPSLEERRMRYEPDYHEAPTWRRPGSVPVNVVPLRSIEGPPVPDQAWYERPELAALEAEWVATGALSGMRIPAELRGFVYKTVLALRSAGEEVGVGSVVASVSRWLPSEDAERVRAGLEAVNRPRDV
jgi:hypothetical protein